MLISNRIEYGETAQGLQTLSNAQTINVSNDSASVPLSRQLILLSLFI